MMPYSQSPKNLKIAAGIFIVSLILLGTGSFFLISGVKLGQIAVQPSPTPQTPSSEIIIPVHPVSVIQPIIQPCLFVYFHGCSVHIAQNLINQTNQYENFALADIQYILTYNQTSTLPSYSEIVPDSFIETYSPESVSSRSAQTQKNLSAEQILQKVALKDNISPRLLLTLMEVLRDGKGVLITQRNGQAPFFDKNEGFANQLISVSQELAKSSLKYEILQHDGQPLPNEITFFGKTYQISNQMNPQSLAVIEFLGNHTSGKSQFEQAVVTNITDQIPTNNFVGLYQKLFQIDPSSPQ